MHRDGYEPIKVLPDHYARLQDNICIFIFSARSVFKTQILSNSIFFRLTFKIFLSLYSWLQSITVSLSKKTKYSQK